jgi:UDP-N-acetylmuramate dehydrogenase
MTMLTMSTFTLLPSLRAEFGDAVQENISLAPYTSARIGGSADVMVTVKSAAELVKTVTYLRENGIPFHILGGGSNTLVSDKGVRELVLLDRAKAIRFETGDQPSVWAEAGVSFSQLAHRAATKGLSGLEWAATVPGTVGGAVYGNAGAFGGDVAHDLIHAEVFTESGLETWPAEKFGYGYRTSILKRDEVRGIVISAQFSLKNASREEVSATIEQFSARRKATQPPGASMGSMFKNPEGDYAGRLIEAAGLKGTRIGNAEISPVHGNFFINHGQTRASDIHALIELVQKNVFEKFAVNLELEVELIGEW